MAEEFEYQQKKALLPSLPGGGLLRDRCAAANGEASCGKYEGGDGTALGYEGGPQPLCRWGPGLGSLLASLSLTVRQKHTDSDGQQKHLKEGDVCQMNTCEAVGFAAAAGKGKTAEAAALCDEVAMLGAPELCQAPAPGSKKTYCQKFQPKSATTGPDDSKWRVSGIGIK